MTTTVSVQGMGNQTTEETPWKEVRNRRRSSQGRNLVIGKNAENNSVRGLEKRVVLHVSRVDPSVNIEDMESFLKLNFPEVAVERLQSKFPEIYSSFKVSISQENFSYHRKDSNRWKVRHYVDGANIHLTVTKRPTDKNESVSILVQVHATSCSFVSKRGRQQYHRGLKVYLAQVLAMSTFT
nr:unnamed protein product [Callosobruchus analis]